MGRHGENGGWTAEVLGFTAALALTLRQFTVDEVHWLIENHGKAELGHTDMKAIAGVMTNATRLGIIEPTSSWLSSVRNPDRPIRVWSIAPHAREILMDIPSVPLLTDDDVSNAFVALSEVAAQRSAAIMAQVRKVRAE